MLMNPPVGGDTFTGNSGVEYSGASSAAVLNVATPDVREALIRQWTEVQDQSPPGPPSGLPDAVALTGAEIVEISQLETLVQTTVQAIANLGAGGNVIPEQSSTSLIANYPPTQSAGKICNTTDMNLMACDGTRWNVSTPPPPPGAVQAGYGKLLYMHFPVLADIGNWNGSANTNGTFRLYSGYAPYGYQPDSTAYAQDATTGQLALKYQGSGSTGNGLLTLWPYATAKLYANYGQFPSIQGRRGFHFECACTTNSNATDVFNASFLMAQEHNNEQDDSDPTYAAQWERYHEFDNNESGHGTDHAGAFRGAYLQWSGRFNWSNTFTSAPSGTITTFPALSTPWGGETLTMNLTLGGSGQVIAANFVNGSTTVTCASTTITGTPTATFTTSFQTILNNSNVNTTPVDYTVEHICGITYDPVEQTVTSWLDGSVTGQVSTASGSSNTFRDSLHYGPIFQMASHGTPFTNTTMLLRYYAMWSS